MGKILCRKKRRRKRRIGKDKISRKETVTRAYICDYTGVQLYCHCVVCGGKKTRRLQRNNAWHC